MKEKQNKLRLSRFVFFLPLPKTKYTAIYHSINMEVVFVLKKITKFLISSSIEEAKIDSGLIREMRKRKMLVEIGFDELASYRKIQKEVDRHAPFDTFYLILTEQCNFRCRYCFILGEKEKSQGKNMTPSTARSSIDLFTRVLSKGPKLHREPAIVFYGGEPLLNFKTMLSALNYIKKLKRKKVLPKNLIVCLNTNASLVTSQIAKILAAHKVVVTISLDGPEKIHDKERIYPTGKGTFRKTIRGFKILKKAGVDISISSVASETNVKQLPKIANWFIEKLDADSLGFNILRQSESGRLLKKPNEYAHDFAKAIIETFKICREKGASEDRMDRKAEVFASKQPYLSDCAGCGNQLVVTPSGKIGLCQATVGKEDWVTPSTPRFNPVTHPYWREWRKRSPFNMPQCLGCIALGICGGGCPYEAQFTKGSIWEVDENFCVHAKESLKFLIQDLFEKTASIGKA